MASCDIKLLISWPMASCHISYFLTKECCNDLNPHHWYQHPDVVSGKLLNAELLLACFHCGAVVGSKVVLVNIELLKLWNLLFLCWYNVLISCSGIPWCHLIIMFWDCVLGCSDIVCLRYSDIVFWVTLISCAPARTRKPRLCISSTHSEQRNLEQDS